jgi:hypothetical protein
VEPQRPELRAFRRRLDPLRPGVVRQYGEAITDLEVGPASLEDAYISLVREFESGREGRAAREFEEVVG